MDELSLSIIHTIHIIGCSRHHFVIREDQELFLLINLFGINSDARGPAGCFAVCLLAILILAPSFSTLNGATSPHLCLSVHSVFIVLSKGVQKNLHKYAARILWISLALSNLIWVSLRFLISLAPLSLTRSACLCCL